MLSLVLIIGSLKMDDKIRLWTKAMLDAVHSPKLEYKSYKLDFFAYESGSYCNGPRCVACGVGWCWHCYNIDAIQECKG